MRNCGFVSLFRWVFISSVSISFFYLNSSAWACGAKKAQFETVALQQRLLEPGFAAVGLPGGSSVPMANGSVCLSPPWWIIRSELLNSIGKSPGVTVGAPEAVSSFGRRDVRDFSEAELQGVQSSLFSIEVHASTMERARALAFVLKPLYQAGQSSVSVWVSGPENPTLPVSAPFPVSGIDLPSFVQQQFTYALDGNPYFVAFTPKQRVPMLPAFFMIFSREEIQFYADNLCDAYRNVNLVAENVFADVLNLTYFSGSLQVGVSTVEKGISTHPSHFLN